MRSVDPTMEIDYTQLEVNNMENYKQIYYLLFNAITDAIGQMEQQNYGLAKDLLIRAQQRAEECYMAETEER